MSENKYEELINLANELSISIEDLDDMEVLCGCTGVSCETAMLW